MTQRRPRPRRRPGGATGPRLGRLVAARAIPAALAAIALTSQSDAVADAASTYGIAPVAPTTVARDGHFADPYPIRRTTSAVPPTLAGTFKELLTCTGPLRARCYRPSAIHVSLDGSLLGRLRREGLRLDSTKAHHPFQLPDGSWHMVFTVEVSDPSRPKDKHWNVIVHGRPVGAATVGGVPTRWVGDSVLAGSLTRRGEGNYNGKYFEASGHLYLLYQKQISSSPKRFGIVAQRLRSPHKRADVHAVTLLQPTTARGGFASENYFGPDQSSNFKLVETANITKINGKYVMVYSVGAFNRPDYKIGLAYSDTFLPRHGATYRRILTTDATGVWGEPGHAEVRYLLQSEKPAWPNYAAGAVQAPGVGSIVPTGKTWSLFLAGYDPSEHPEGPKHTFTASHRRTFFLPLEVTVPADRSVAEATDRELATWIKPGA